MMASRILWVFAMVFAVLMVVGFGHPRVYAQNVHQSLGTYVVAKNQTLHGNITLNVGNVVVRGRVDGNVTVNIGNVVVSGVVSGNVNVGTGNISLQGAGHIDGTRIVGTGSATGPTGFAGFPAWGNIHGPIWHWVPDAWVSLGGFWSGLTVKLLLNMVLSGVLVTLFPAALQSVVADIEKGPVRAAATGCLSVIAWIVAMIGLTVIVIGIPLTILLAIGGVVVGVMANAAVIWLIGQRVEQTAWPLRERHPYIELALGAVLVTIVELIPGIGGLLTLLLAMVGTGAVLRSRFGTNRPWWPIRR